MKTGQKLTPESMAEISNGMRRITAVAINLDAWQTKLIGLGVEVDTAIFNEVQAGLLQLHGDMFAVIESGLAMHRKSKPKPKPKPAPYMGWKCVPGVH